MSGAGVIEVMGALTLFLLTVAPLEIEPWGLTLAARGEVLEVTAVKTGGPAAHAGVKVGSQLARILMPVPKRPKAIGQLDADSLEDAAATLREATQPQVVLQLGARDAQEQKVLQRDPFIPKGEKELRAMTPLEMSQYFYDLSNATVRTQPPPPITVDFGRRGPLAVVDPVKHTLLAIRSGEATGEQVWLALALGYNCPDSRAVSAKVKGAQAASSVVVDLSANKLHGGVQGFLFPAARLADVVKCPATPITQVLELELKCEKGEPLLGREKLQLAVDCSGSPRDIDDYLSPLFTGISPNLMETSVREGFQEITVRTWVDSPGPLPVRLDLLVLDAKGKTVVHAPRLWKMDASTRLEGLGDGKFAAPRAPGKYAVVFEATWADGSRSRSLAEPLVVLSAADDEKQKAAWEAGTKTYFQLSDRLNAQRIDLCDSKKAIAWLRAQPEVESVSEQEDGDYSYLVKNHPVPTAVHCH